MLKFLVLFLFTIGSSLGSIHDVGYQKHVQTQCSFTRFPALCQQTLLVSQNHPGLVLSLLVNKTMSETKLPDSFFNALSTTSQLESQESHHAKFLTEYCQDLMKMSLKRLDQSIMALKNSPTKNKHNIQTWLSAALTFQQACKDSANNVNGVTTNLITSHISQKMDYLSSLASNSLALVNRITSSETTRERNLIEKQEFPDWVSVKNRKILQSNTIKANAVVAQDGTGNYKTIAEAIEAASGARFVIYVKSGFYKEKIRMNKDGITLIGDGKYSTIIIGDDSVGAGTYMPDTATFTVSGDGFIARDIGFQNTAGPQGEQALALYVKADHSVFYRCSMAGYQDTLYALALRQFYKECDIYGTIDFIFGNAAAVFQNCNLAFRRPRSGSYNVMLANGRTDPGQNTGFSLQKCRIIASSEFSPAKHSFQSFLGRPWKQYSRSVVMESSIDDVVASPGWVAWPGAESYSKTLYFAEYANTGPGAGTGNRPKWPGYHVIGATEAVKFTVGSFISGSSWIPSTGVSFTSGL